ncbi:hypothetical protein L6164_017724 [Bauhinia variegata]|uniref:Uncharacterized protein n=1 Tax=Bauhinia variegata TaxID=167791 RepID=A0ACB9NA44_BAUVA|nr:hypothetical protein L6164_017724 [Bauhinia variegata]
MNVKIQGVDPMVHLSDSHSSSKVGSNHCGYPGFDLLSCTPDKETVLELPLPADPFPARFYVHDIDYKAQKILVNNPKEYCLSTQLLKLAHSPSPLFQYYPYDLTFFNCSLSSSPCPIRVVDFETDVSTQVSCTKMRDVLLPGTSAPQYQGYFSTDIYYRDSFQISWTKPNCTGCQERGQKCHFIDNEIQCISTKHKGNIIVNANSHQAKVFSDIYGKIVNIIC